jgi:hypothetical protein
MRRFIDRSVWFSELWIYSPALLSILIMLPRLTSAQFGLFDDGTTITKAQEITHGIWNMGWETLSGRFRPVYWLFYTLPYWLFGKSPFWYFIENLIVFIITTVILIGLVRKLGGSRSQAWLTGVLFVLSGPVIENYYTLSKPEEVQVAFLASSLLVIAFVNRFQNLWRNIFLTLLAALLIFLANTSKETTLVILPISIGWFVMAWLWQRWRKRTSGFQGRAAYLIASFLGTMAYLGLRAVFTSRQLNAGSYTGNYVFGLSRILASAVRWSGWLLRDYLYLVPFLFIFILWALILKKLPQGTLILDILLWMAAWVLVYLPWVFTVEYYMLPFSLGAALLGAILIEQVWTLLRSSPPSGILLPVLCILLSVVLFLATLVNNLSNARIQLAVDAANAEMLIQISRTLPQDSTILVNIQSANEYVDEIPVHLAVIWGRPDIKVYPVILQDGGQKGVSGLKQYFILSPFMQNQPKLSVRLGVLENTQQRWNQSLSEVYRDQLQEIYRTEHSFTMSSIDLLSLACPFMRGQSYCANNPSAIDRRVFSYGWLLYKVEN